MSTWTKQKLGDLAEIVSGGTPSSTNPSYWEDGNICWVTLSDQKSKYLLDTERKITKLGLKNSSAKLLPINTIIFSSRATIGQISITKVETTTNQGSKNLICDATKANFEYLYYCLKHKSKEIEQLASGATYKEINKTVLSNIKIEIPNLSTQTHIASVLSAYDDLIENNEKRIKALEEMAQLLYTEWFVKFKFPGYEKIHMVDSGTEYGKIPQIFSVKHINKLIEFVRGVEPGSANYNTVIGVGLLPFLRVGDLGSRNSGLFIEKSVTKGKILEREDIAITMDGTVGRVVIGMYGAYSTGIRKLVIKDQTINREFLFFLMISDYMQNIIKAYAKGSTILHASESIKYMKVLLPTKELMDEFGRRVKPIIDQILNLQDKNRALSQIRDLLIPELVTGKRELK